MAQSYVDEHLNEEGSYELFVCKIESSLIQVKMQSRHVQNKKYKLWIQYDSSSNTITGWYCKCKTGARTVGCCAHICSAIMYLAYYRHKDKDTVRPSRFFRDFVDDAAMAEFDLDEDHESEDSDTTGNETATDEDMSDDD